jgi:hypothetical protein
MDSWSLDRDPGDTPTFVHLLGHVDEAAAVALLNHDLRAFGVATVNASVPPDFRYPQSPCGSFPCRIAVYTRLG